MCVMFDSQNRGHKDEINSHCPILSGASRGSSYEARETTKKGGKGRDGGTQKSAVTPLPTERLALEIYVW